MASTHSVTAVASGDIADLKEQIKDLTAQLEGRKHVNVLVNSENQRLKRLLRDLELRVADFETGKPRAVGERATVTALRNAVQTARLNHEDANAELGLASEINESLKQQVQATENGLRSTEAELQSLQKQLEDTHAALEHAQRTGEQLAIDREQSARKCLELQQVVADLTGSKQQLEEQLQTAIREKESLHQAMQGEMEVHKKTAQNALKEAELRVEAERSAASAASSAQALEMQATLKANMDDVNHRLAQAAAMLQASDWTVREASRDSWTTGSRPGTDAAAAAGAPSAMTSTPPPGARTPALAAVASPTLQPAEEGLNALEILVHDVSLKTASLGKSRGEVWPVLAMSCPGVGRLPIAALDPLQSAPSAIRQLLAFPFTVSTEAIAKLRTDHVLLELVDGRAAFIGGYKLQGNSTDPTDVSFVAAIAFAHPSGAPGVALFELKPGTPVLPGGLLGRFQGLLTSEPGGVALAEGQVLVDLRGLPPPQLDAARTSGLFETDGQALVHGQDGEQFQLWKLAGVGARHEATLINVPGVAARVAELPFGPSAAALLTCSVPLSAALAAPSTSTLRGSIQQSALQSAQTAQLHDALDAHGTRTAELVDATGRGGGSVQITLRLQQPVGYVLPLMQQLEPFLKPEVQEALTWAQQPLTRVLKQQQRLALAPVELLAAGRQLLETVLTGGPFHSAAAQPSDQLRQAVTRGLGEVKAAALSVQESIVVPETHETTDASQHALVKLLQETLRSQTGRSAARLYGEALHLQSLYRLAMVVWQLNGYRLHNVLSSTLSLQQSSLLEECVAGIKDLEGGAGPSPAVPGLPAAEQAGAEVAAAARVRQVAERAMQAMQPAVDKAVKGCNDATAAARKLLAPADADEDAVLAAAHAEVYRQLAGVTACTMREMQGVLHECAAALAPFVMHDKAVQGRTGDARQHSTCWAATSSPAAQDAVAAVQQLLASWHMGCCQVSRADPTEPEPSKEGRLAWHRCVLKLRTQMLCTSSFWAALMAAGCGHTLLLAGQRGTAVSLLVQMAARDLERLTASVETTFSGLQKALGEDAASLEVLGPVAAANLTVQLVCCMRTFYEAAQQLALTPVALARRRHCRTQPPPPAALVADDTTELVVATASFSRMKQLLGKAAAARPALHRRQPSATRSMMAFSAALGTDLGTDPGAGSTGPSSGMAAQGGSRGAGMAHAACGTADAAGGLWAAVSELQGAYELADWRPKGNVLLVKVELEDGDAPKDVPGGVESSPAGADSGAAPVEQVDVMQLARAAAMQLGWGCKALEDYLIEDFATEEELVERISSQVDACLVVGEATQVASTLELLSRKSVAVIDAEQWVTESSYLADEAALSLRLAAAKAHASPRASGSLVGPQPARPPGDRDAAMCLVARAVAAQLLALEPATPASSVDDATAASSGLFADNPVSPRSRRQSGTGSAAAQPLSPPSPRLRRQSSGSVVAAQPPGTPGAGYKALMSREYWGSDAGRSAAPLLHGSLLEDETASRVIPELEKLYKGMAAALDRLAACPDLNPKLTKALVAAVRKLARMLEQNHVLLEGMLRSPQLMRVQQILAQVHGLEAQHLQQAQKHQAALEADTARSDSTITELAEAGVQQGLPATSLDNLFDGDSEVSSIYSYSAASRALLPSTRTLSRRSSSQLLQDLPDSFVASPGPLLPSSRPPSRRASGGSLQGGTGVSLPNISRP